MLCFKLLMLLLVAACIRVARNILSPSLIMPLLLQGAYKSGKMKFPEFSMFSRPSKQSFPDNYKRKPNVTNHLSSQFGSFLAELQNILLKEHGD